MTTDTQENLNIREPSYEYKADCFTDDEIGIAKAAMAHPSMSRVRFYSGKEQMLVIPPKSMTDHAMESPITISVVRDTGMPDIRIYRYTMFSEPEHVVDHAAVQYHVIRDGKPRRVLSYDFKESITRMCAAITCPLFSFPDMTITGFFHIDKYAPQAPILFLADEGTKEPPRDYSLDAVEYANYFRALFPIYHATDRLKDWLVHKELASRHLDYLVGEFDIVDIRIKQNRGNFDVYYTLTQKGRTYRECMPVFWDTFFKVITSEDPNISVNPFSMEKFRKVDNRLAVEPTQFVSLGPKVRELSPFDRETLASMLVPEPESDTNQKVTGA